MEGVGPRRELTGEAVDGIADTEKQLERAVTLSDNDSSIKYVRAMRHAQAEKAVKVPEVIFIDARKRLPASKR